MAGICTYAPLLEQKQIDTDSSFTALSPGDIEDSFENYTLIPVEKTGFVVIKNVISPDDWDEDEG